MEHVVFFIDIQNLKPVVCHCKRQKCKGLFIPSRINQETCLFDLAERGVLDRFKPIKDKRYTLSQLALHILKLEEPSVPDEALTYDYYDLFDSFEEMVE